MKAEKGEGREHILVKRRWNREGGQKTGMAAEGETDKKKTQK